MLWFSTKQFSYFYQVKVLLLFFLSFLPLCLLAQNLKVIDKESGEVAHEFKPGDRVFLLTKDINPTQTGIFIKATKDSAFFSHDSFAIAEIENIVRDRNGNYCSFFLCSGAELFGSGLQAVGFGFWYFSGATSDFDTEQYAFAAFIGAYFYVQGFVVKWIGRSLKSELFHLSKYSNTKYDFIGD